MAGTSRQAAVAMDAMRNALMCPSPQSFKGPEEDGRGGGTKNLWALPMLNCVIVAAAVVQRLGGPEGGAGAEEDGCGGGRPPPQGHPHRP